MVKEENQKDKNRSLKITFRVFQATFLGIFALGISSVLGDLSNYVQIPISGFSIVSTIFGLIGSIITGTLAKQSEKW